jgi:hypothetical protein
VSRSRALPSTGTEALDWQEVWCMRCRHDHDMHHPNDDPPGCMIWLNAITDQPTPEIVPAGYTVRYHDDDGDHHTHVISAVCNSLPAAAFCTAWEPCEPGCMRHVNGAIIDGHDIGEAW